MLLLSDLRVFRLRFGCRWYNTFTLTEGFVARFSVPHAVVLYFLIRILVVSSIVCGASEL